MDGGSSLSESDFDLTREELRAEVIRTPLEFYNSIVKSLIDDVRRKCEEIGSIMSHDLINVFSILESDSSILSASLDDVSDEIRGAINEVQKTIDFILNLIIRDSNYDQVSQSSTIAEKVIETIQLKFKENPTLTKKEVVKKYLSGDL